MAALAAEPVQEARPVYGPVQDARTEAPAARKCGPPAPPSPPVVHMTAMRAVRLVVVLQAPVELHACMQRVCQPGCQHRAALVR